MKSTTYIRPAVSLVFIFFAAALSKACGPYNPLIPTPEFFALSGYPKPLSYYDKQENLLLWQSLTDSRIPLDDIEQAVYKDSAAEFSERAYSSSSTSGNKFYNYLRNSNDSEITSLISTAKRMEEGWAAIKSPWYYPETREWDSEPGDFEDIIENCKSYTGTRLKDRYGLQGVRAYFASRRYSECIEYYDSTFSSIADDNLMKRMAQRYVAGCWARLGDSERADSVFAVAGDIWSITRSDRVEYMISRNPGAPQLIEYIRDNANDTTFMKKCAELAKTIVRDKRVKYKGDWLFLSAYVNNEYNNNSRVARSSIRQALRHGFSTDELAALARLYKMKLDAQSGNRSSLLTDLKWIESHADFVSANVVEWANRLQNIVYVDWIPTLWKSKDYATAILLCSYADNFLNESQMHYARTPSGRIYWAPPVVVTLEELRASEKYINMYDYSCLSFQLMGSLTSSQLASAYTKIMSDTPLYNYLRRKARTDSDYFNELIGTLAIREENYDRAVSYLSLVSPGYQRTLNVYKEKYLSGDPFATYPTRWDSYKSDIPGSETIYFEFAASSHKERKPLDNAKLNFAKQMRTYARTMKHGKTADERGLARLMYAIGRRNSFEECWALTQYWRGSSPNLFEPYLMYDEDVEFTEINYSFLYDYYDCDGYKNTESTYKNEIKAAIAMMRSDEARAKAEYILGNLVTVVKRYPSTKTAQYVKTSCDNWTSWI